MIVQPSRVCVFGKRRRHSIPLPDASAKAISGVFETTAIIHIREKLICLGAEEERDRIRL